jgi:3,4-dihydroxy 2-butanone 4-phosphate synthase/GTP cyclohydrolase II
VPPVALQRLTQARLPTPEGEFQLVLYRTPDEKEHLALTLGAVAGEDILVRIHSECLTGDVLGSTRCDCGGQLHRAMEVLAQEGRGVLIYLRQEGRGIGLHDKLRAYILQDQGFDTVEANLILGHQADEREYSAAADILRDLGVTSVRLLTNNPSKIEAMQELGIPVRSREPLHSPVTSENAGYLRAKAERLRHWIVVGPPGDGSR